jgi:hypothetical protein
MLDVVFLARDSYLKWLTGGSEWPCKLKRQYQQDRQWVRSDDASDAFSFIRVCEALGLDATAVREAYFSSRSLNLLKRSESEER